MSLVNVVGMVVLDNPTSFQNPFQFEITFECLQPLSDDIEWKVTYVGSAEDSSLDQVLDEVMVGPVPVGTNKFVLQADAPDHTVIPPEDVLGVTVVLVTASYKDAEFCRVGYYVNNEYSDPYDPETGPPSPLDMTKVTRQILADKPRVTRFPIDWTNGAQGTSTNSTNLEMNESEAMQSPVPSLGAASTPSDNDVTPGNFEGVDVTGMDTL
ncbi:hypothetical protein TrVE_jg10235 [Triparma verrucosa]|uniref:Anti-silencing function protein 1 n=2 Tax=Triparma TaxID=722752 RepID=A0A9W7EYD6_9STRA|nr:hypothetical protein TrVE_jg10235 [Triparma verrucosa]GMH96348.1 hypothetical protein TrST_g1425 [Triparma strigata]